jgi:hypothetical protein
MLRFVIAALLSVTILSGFTKPGSAQPTGSTASLGTTVPANPGNDAKLNQTNNSGSSAGPVQGPVYKAFYGRNL